MSLQQQPFYQAWLAGFFCDILKMNQSLAPSNSTHQHPVFEGIPPSIALEGAKEERVEFRASGGLLEILNQLRTTYGLSRSETIRRAVALFFIAKREQSKGLRLALIDGNGNVVSEVHSV